VSLKVVGNVVLVQFFVSVKSKRAHPPLPRANPWAFDFFEKKKIGQIPHYVGSLQRHMPHRSGLQSQIPTL